MVKSCIFPCSFSTTRSVIFSVLLIMLIFPVPLSAEEYKVPEEQHKIEDKSEEEFLQDESIETKLSDEQKNSDEEYAISEENQEEDECSEDASQDESIDKKFPGSQIIDELEITIKPKVDDTIRSECIHPPLSVKYGITPHWDFSFRLNTFLNNPLRGRTRNGVSDVSIGTRYHWQRLLKPYLDAITAFSVQIPAGDSEDISDEYTHYRPELKFIKKFPEWYKLQISATVNMDLLSGSSHSIELLDQDPLDNSLTLIFGVLFPVNIFNYSIETEWATTEIDEGNQNSVYLTTGIFYEVPERKHPWMRGAMNFGCGVRIGLNDTEDSFAFFARLNWDFPFKMRLKKRAKKETSS